jgi:hypothetical protein
MQVINQTIAPRPTVAAARLVWYKTWGAERYDAAGWSNPEALPLILDALMIGMLCRNVALAITCTCDSGDCCEETCVSTVRRSVMDFCVVMKLRLSRRGSAPLSSDEFVLNVAKP